MSKINLELGGKYSAGEMFQRAQNDIKAFGRTNKDAIKAGNDVLKELEKGFGQDLSGAIGTTRSVLQNLATGGIWGALGAAAGAVISKVVEWFNEAKEATIRFSAACKDYVTKSLKNIDNEFKNVVSDASTAKQEIQDFANIAQGKIVNAANAKIHELHIETLQKITDNMSETAKKVILADEALEVAKIKEEAAIRIATQKANEQREKRDEVEGILDAAIERREAVEKELATLNSLQTGPIKRYNVLQEYQNNIMTLYNANAISASELKEKETWLQEQTNKLMEKHKDAIDAYLALQDKLEQAKKDELSAEENYEHEKRVLTTVVQQNKDALLSAKTAVVNATQAKKDAELADKKYAEQQNELAQKEQKREEEKQAAHNKKQRLEQEQMELLEAENQERKANQISALKECWRLKMDEARFMRLYNQEILEGAEHEEALDNARIRCQNLMQVEAQITKLCNEKKVESKDYIRRFNEIIDKGVDVSDAYAQVQKELNDKLKERTDAEKDATKELQEGNKNAKEGNGKEGQKQKPLKVEMSANLMGDIGEQVERKFTFKEWQKQNRIEARKVRDAKNNMKVDQPAMAKALKGEMPKEQANQWMEYAKRKYTPDQMRELGKLAMNKELLSKSEKKKQLAKIEYMAKAIEKALAIK